MLKIEIVLCRAGTMDNYSYIITDSDTNISAVIDPSEAEPIIQRCKELNITPQYILNTHHHFDHTDANIILKNLYHAQVVGNQADAERIPGFDLGVKDGGTFALGNSIAQIIDVSAHTQGHILWYFAQDKALFTGDTLFNLCVGGLFEGNTEQMFKALDKIRSLPDDVMFYPGHEYTAQGAGFAQQYFAGRPELKEYFALAQERLNNGLPVAPIPLGLEKACNPYLAAENLAELKQIL